MIDILKRLTSKAGSNLPAATSTASDPASDHEAQLLSLHRQRLQDIQFVAEPDGTQVSVAAYEQRIAQQYAQDLAQLQSWWSPKLERLRTKIQNLRQELSRFRRRSLDEVARVVQNLMQRQVEELKEVDAQLARREADLQQRVENRIHRPFSAVKRRLQLLQQQVGRTETDAAFSSVWLYGMALGGIGIGELSFNQDVFAGLGSNQIEAYVNAFMLVVAVPVFAHTTGYFLKCRDSIRHTGVRLSVAGVIVVMAGVLSLFLGRERYKLLLGNPLLDPDAGTLVFAALVTFGMYVVGVLLSYMFHDSNSQFRRVCRAFQQARQRRDQEFDDVQAERSQFQAEHDRLRKKIRTDGATGIDGVRNAGRVLADTYREQAASYNECLAEAQALERLTSSRYEEAVQVFRSERGVVRPNDAEPDGGAADVQALRLVLAQVRPVDVSEGLTGDRTEAVERVSTDAGHAYQLAAADECQQPAEVQ